MLVLDHKNSDGGARRRAGLDSSGKNFYASLLDAPLRDDLQVLCASCNQRKINYGPNISEWPCTFREGRVYYSV